MARFGLAAIPHFIDQMNFGEDLSLQVMLAHKSYHHYLFKVLKEINIYQHYQILLLLNRAGGRATQKSLCDSLQIEKSNMASVIELLQSKGYVISEVNFKDRRGKLISLTEKSNQLLAVVSDLFSSFEDGMADEITWQEMNDCLRVLQKVNDRFKHIMEQQINIPATYKTAN